MLLFLKASFDFNTYCKILEFVKYIIEENVDYNNIFFTEEKRFLIKFAPNKQIFKVRLTKESKKNKETKKLKNDDSRNRKILKE